MASPSKKRGQTATRATSDAAKLARVKEQLPCLAHYLPLNVGTSGPLPKVALKALQATAREEVYEGRHRPVGWLALRERKELLRQACGRVIGAPPGSIALTHHTTDGMNIGTAAFQWRPGDEAITTTIEHMGGLMPLATVRERYGVTIKFAEVGLGGGDVVEKLAALVTPRTRLISLSHVSYSTGALLPLKEIVAMAHRQGVPVLVDGAQSAGAIPVDVQDTGVDLYALPGQKWLCGPEGTGALYVRPEILPELRLTFAGYASIQGHDQTGNYLPQHGAQRFEVGGMNWALLAALEASLVWLERDVGYAWAWSRIARLARQARRSLAAIPGVTVLTPENMAGLVCFRIQGVDPAAGVAWLWERGYQVRTIPEQACLRVSTGFFVAEEELKGFCAAVADLAREKPATAAAAAAAD